MNISELRERWSYLRFEEAGLGIRVWLNPFKENNGSSSMGIHELNANMMTALDKANERQKVFMENQAKYPNLWFYVDQYTLEVRDAWVNRSNRDAESLGVSPETFKDPILLEHLNAEAGRALQEGWFFCTGCSEAHPKEEYGYFYFAGSYCKKHAVEHPEHRRQAALESYN